MSKVSSKPLKSKPPQINIALEKYLSILNFAPEPILIADSQIKIVYVNPAWEKLTGYKSREVIGRDPKILQSGKTPRKVFNKLWQSLRNNIPFTTEEVIDKRKDGTYYQIHSTFFPILENDKPLFYIQIQHDISERKIQEQTQRWVQNLVQMSNDAIITVAPKLKITSWNPAAENLYGYRAEDIIGKSLKTLVPKNKAAELKRIYGDIDSKFVNFETERLTKDGRLINVSITISHLLDGDNKIIGYSVIHRDITTQKKLSELKNEFLSVAAHELKTPITTLKLMSQAHIARIKRYGSDQLKLDELELIDRELERLTQLINDILDDTRVESGKLFLKLEQTNLNKLLVTVIKKMALLTRKQKIVFIKPDKKIAVIIDQQRIEQVLVNLLSNAIKYSEPKSRIEVGAGIEKSKALVWISDQGQGIPESQRTKIFDRYYQLREKNSRGFGLGLYITKQIIDQHKGKIWVESRKGKGSVFFFTLPLKK